MLKPPNGATSNRISGPTTNPSWTPLPYTPPPLMAKVGRKIPKSGAKSRLATERPVSPSSMPLRLHKPIWFRDTPPRKPGRARNVSSAPTRSFWVLSPSSLSLSPKLWPYTGPSAKVKRRGSSGAGSGIGAGASAAGGGALGGGGGRRRGGRRRLRDDDLDPPVAGLAHPVRGWHQQILLAPADG